MGLECRAIYLFFRVKKIPKIVQIKMIGATLTKSHSKA